MTDFTDLQARITAALDRIGSGLEALDRAGGQDVPEGEGGEVERLTTALDDERTANAQLEERVRAIKQKQDSAVTALEHEVGRLRDLLEAEEVAVSRLSRVNAELRANNAALREAIAAGLAEPHLVNKSMMTELEALRAVQGADRAELDAVLDELGPLVAEVQDRAVAEGENEADA